MSGHGSGSAEEVRCTDCGYLDNVRNHEAGVDRYQRTSGSFKPQCFRSAWPLETEFQGIYDKDPNGYRDGVPPDMYAAKAVAARLRTCSDFIPFERGLMPREHLELEFAERLEAQRREWDERWKVRDQEWDAKLAADRQAFEERMDARRTDDERRMRSRDLWAAAVGIAIGALIGGGQIAAAVLTR